MQNYSVLMSVYHKEKPEYLRQAIESIQSQTVPASDFVLVCDGPFTKEFINHLVVPVMCTVGFQFRFKFRFA